MKTGDWTVCGLDKFEISQDQFEELKKRRSILIPHGGVTIVVEPGEYSPPSDDRHQGVLFDS
jgi:hypothetical protein